MKNLDAARHEYITTNISYAKLAEKYGVAMSTVYERARKEEWQKKREDFREKTDKKTISNGSTTVAKRRKAILEGADELLVKWQGCLSRCHEDDINKLKKLSEILLNIKDAAMITTAGDEKEQKARIKKLLHDCEEDEKLKTVRVVMEGCEEFEN